MAYKEAKNGNNKYRLDFDTPKADPCKETENIEFSINKMRFIKSEVGGILSESTINDDNESASLIDFNFDVNNLDPNVDIPGAVIINVSRVTPIFDVVCCTEEEINLRIRKKRQMGKIPDTLNLYQGASSEVNITFDYSQSRWIKKDSYDETSLTESTLIESDNSEYTDMVVIPFTYRYNGEPCFTKAQLEVISEITSCNGNELDSPKIESQTLEVGLPCGSSLDTGNYPAIEINSNWTLAPATYSIGVPDDIDTEEYFLVLEYDNRSIPDAMGVVYENALLDEDQDCGSTDKNTIQNLNSIDVDSKLKYLKSDGNGFVDDDTYKRTYMPTSDESYILYRESLKDNTATPADFSNNDRQRGMPKSPYISEDLNGRGMLYLDFSPSSNLNNTNIRIFTKYWSQYLSAVKWMKSFLNYNLDANWSTYRGYSESAVGSNTNQGLIKKMYQYVDNQMARNTQGGEIIDESKLYAVTSYKYKIHCPIKKSLYPNGPLTAEIVGTPKNNSDDKANPNIDMRIKIMGGHPPYIVKMTTALRYGIASVNAGYHQYAKVEPNNSSLSYRIETTEAIIPAASPSSEAYLAYPTNIVFQQGVNDLLYYDDNATVNASNEYIFDNSKRVEDTIFYGTTYLTENKKEQRDNVDYVTDSGFASVSTNVIYGERDSNTLTRRTPITIMIWDSSDQVLDSNQYQLGDLINAAPEQKNKMFAIIPYVYIERDVPITVDINPCTERTQRITIKGIPDGDLINMQLEINSVLNDASDVYLDNTDLSTKVSSSSKSPGFCQVQDVSAPFTEGDTGIQPDLTSFENAVSATMTYNGNSANVISSTGVVPGTTDITINLNNLNDCVCNDNLYNIIFKAGSPQKTIADYSREFYNCNSSRYLRAYATYEYSNDTGIIPDMNNMSSWRVRHSIPGTTTIKVNNVRGNGAHDTDTLALLNLRLKATTVTLQSNDSIIDKLFNTFSSNDRLYKGSYIVEYDIISLNNNTSTNIPSCVLIKDTIGIRITENVRVTNE